MKKLKKEYIQLRLNQFDCHPVDTQEITYFFSLVQYNIDDKFVYSDDTSKTSILTFSDLNQKLFISFTREVLKVLELNQRLGTSESVAYIMSALDEVFTAQDSHESNFIEYVKSGKSLFFTVVSSKEEY